MSKRLYFETKGHGRDLVLVHPWLLSSAAWFPLVNHLTRHYRVTLVDLPGCGRSPLLTKLYDIQTVAEQVLAVAPKEANWMGWSLGGLISLWVALNAPRRVNHLVTVASTPRFMEAPDWPGLPDVSILRLLEKLAHDRHLSLSSFLKQQIFQNTEYRVLTRYFIKGLYQHFSPHMRAIRGGLEIVRQTDLRGALPGLSCPSLHILGELDFIVPVEVATPLQKLRPQGTVHIMKKANHAPFLFQPTNFLKIVNQFI